MKKIIVMFLALAMVLSFVACGNKVDDKDNAPAGDASAKAEYKLGLGVVVSMDSSSDKTEDKAALARVDATIASVVLDKDGKIVEAELDSVQLQANVTDGKFADLDKVNLLTKKELKENYEMKSFSGIGKEWYEQAAAYADKLVGKTVADVKALTLGDKGAPADADLSAVCTIAVSDFNAAIVAACEDAQAKTFTAAEGFKLGLDVDNDVSGSADYNADKETNATAKFVSTFAATVVDAEGKVVAALLDEIQPEIQIDNDGKVVDKKYTNTKRHLKEDYGMKAFAQDCIAEWYVQGKSLTDYVVGKTADEIKNIKTESGRPTDADLSASVTIAIGSYQTVLAQAIANAQ